jgi:pSer/pThr/pTyr-binding forkhead associated (FHA) protein
MPNPINNTVETPVFSGSTVTSIGVPAVVSEIDDNASPQSGQLAPKVNSTAKLIIDRGEAAGTEFPISRDEATIGRWDADNGIFPDVDLDTFDQEAKVSRRHARVIFRDGKYFLEDLGSTNGTFVNRGRRLLPGTPQPLVDGDEIIVGKTFLRFRINS